MLQKQLDEFWNTILAEVENFLSPGAIERWLKPLKPVSFADNTFTLSADNEVIIQFFEKRYRDFTQDACKEACRKPRRWILPFSFAEFSGRSIMLCRRS